jgi:hypothetical protein
MDLEEAGFVESFEVVWVEFVQLGVQVGVGDSGEFDKTVADTCGDGFQGGMGVGAGGIEVD